MRLDIIGRANRARGGRNVLRRAPADLCAGYLAHPFEKKVVFLERICQVASSECEQTETREPAQRGDVDAKELMLK